MHDLFEQKITPVPITVRDIIEQCYIAVKQGDEMAEKSENINKNTKTYFNHQRYALHAGDKTLGYELLLISELLVDSELLRGTIYLEKQEDKINYKIMTTQGVTTYEKTDIVITKDFHELTDDECRELKKHVMDDILKKGHAKCISQIIDDFFVQYATYLDVTAHAFEKNFINGYGERVFELAMANFLNSKFSLIPRTDMEREAGGISDLSFSFNDHDYLLECTTRDSFLVKDYLVFLGDFDKFIDVSSVLHRYHQIWQGKGGPQVQWFVFPDYIFSRLDKDERNNIAEKLGFKIDDDSKKSVYLTPQMILENYFTWLFLTRHMLMHYYDIFPQSIIEMLADVGLTNQAGMSWGRDEEAMFRKALARFVAQCILSKLGKNYFEEGKPVVISVSLSLMADIRLITQAEGLISDIVGYLPGELDALFKNRIENGECRYGIKNPSDSVGKLYAVIIDTSWYNWFPTINKSNMPKGYDNCYGVIYNTNISDAIKAKSDPDIFSQIAPYTHRLPFVLEDEVEEFIV